MVEVVDAMVIRELWTGTYVGAVATESTGYIIIKDSSGTDRKVMIQA